MMYTMTEVKLRGPHIKGLLALGPQDTICAALGVYAKDTAYVCV